jgi:glycosyltransferase involved in cell wall biosynthesis
VTLKIGIVVPGRFHAFDLGRALDRRGHDVTIFTNYPRWAASRFGVDRRRVRSFTRHGIATRMYRRTGSLGLSQRCDPAAHRWFGRWAARELGRESWDVIHCWSGVSEEILQSPAAGQSLTLLMRGSSHIVTQRRLLDDESRRVGADLDRPGDWVVARECREYALADRIVVLSSFSARSFVSEGVPPERLDVLPLGVDVEAFRAAASVLERRQQRVRRGDPLTVLYVGALSYRKGLRDLMDVVRAPAARTMRFRLVGNIMREARSLLTSLPEHVEVLGKVPQSALPQIYSDADVFLFPTIEDGFPVVLAQAHAAGLPIITTPNGAGDDIVTTEREGWIVPIRSPQAILERLEWWTHNRAALAETVAATGGPTHVRTWDHVAAEFERLCESHLGGQAHPIRHAG